LFSPNLVGQIFVGVLFAVLFTPRYGLVNRVLQDLVGWGLEERWLSNPALVMPAIVVTALWLSVGFNMIFFLAALQGVDKTLQEAARVDGANRWEVFRHVTLPSMRHVVGFVLVTSIIASFQLFELPLALLAQTDGKGPDNAGLTLITYLYDVGFSSGDLGLGSAVGWVVATLIFGVSLMQLKLSGLAAEEQA
jgi:ABC-type sugar transport system permease subunit